MDKKLKTQQDTERSKNAVKNGFCYRCIKNPIDPTVSKRYCSICFVKKSQADKKYREKNREHLKEYFMFLDGTPERKAKRKVYRKKSASKEAEKHRQRYLSRKRGGICVYCGKMKPIRGLQYCKVCQDKHREQYRGYKKRLLSGGLCIGCKQPNGRDGFLCAKCSQEGTERLRKWKTANPDKVKSGSAKYFKKNKEREYERVKRWNRENPEMYSASRKRRHYRRDSLEKNVAGYFTSNDWAEILKKYENKCLWCERTGVELTVDHIVPLSKGGTSYPYNLQPLCISCNSKKGTRIIDFRPFGNIILDWT